MKKLILLIILFISFFSCDDNSTKEIVADPPRTSDELNSNVMFNLSLKDKSYQPMHVETCKNRSFIILGNFEKSRKGRDSINFYLFNSHPFKEKPEDTTHLMVNSIKLDSIVNKTIYMDVILKKTVLSQNEINPKGFTFSKIDLKKKNIIDLHLYLNNEKFNCELLKEDGTESTFNIGDHICRGIIIEGP